MTLTDEFSIQRSDGRWYAGRQEDDTPLWSNDARTAHRFDDYDEALRTRQRLHQSGYDVCLYEIRR